MEYRKLGRTGLEVSVICLGTMTWGRQNTEAEGHEQMDYALSQGVNFFDTAEMYAIPPTAQTYGSTETIIGNWLAARKNRDKVILATKIAGPGQPWVRNGQNRLDRPNIIKAIEGSLKRLQTDYIDLYQLHWPNRPTNHFSRRWQAPAKETNPKAERENFLEVLEILNDLIKDGKIRAAGLSNETPWGTMEYLNLAERHGLVRMASIQNEYSLLCRVFEPDLAEIALNEDIGLLAWSPLATGMISGKYLSGKKPPGSRWSLYADTPYRNTSLAQAAVRAYMGIAQKNGLDVCQMALAFVNEQPFVTANIIGATTMEQLKTNIDSINMKLSSKVREEISNIHRQYPIPY